MRPDMVLDACCVLIEPAAPVVPAEKRGFTKKVLEYLRDTKAELKCYSRDYCHSTITAEQLLRIAEMIPSENFEDRQNEAPKFADFVEVAKREPRALFDIYIITDVRSDERVTVEGALIPSDRQDLLDWLLSRALGKPDERYTVRLEGREYVHVWWD